MKTCLINAAFAVVSFISIAVVATIIFLVSGFLKIRYWENYGDGGPVFVVGDVFEINPLYYNVNLHMGPAYWVQVPHHAKDATALEFGQGCRLTAKVVDNALVVTSDFGSFEVTPLDRSPSLLSNGFCQIAVYYDELSDKWWLDLAPNNH